MTSLDAFGAWALRQGQVANPQVNTYKGQCVSLVQQYLYQCYNIPYKARGNAKDFVPPKFHKVSGGYQPGDIIRYGRNYGGGYGHIGIIDVNGKFLDQNGTKRLAVAYRNAPFSGIDAIFRPDNRCALYDAPAHSDLPNGVIPQTGTYYIQVDNLRVREAPSTSAPIVQYNGSDLEYSKGETLKYQGYIDANGYRWVVYRGKNSGQYRYIARRSLDGKQVFGYCK